MRGRVAQSAGPWVVGVTAGGEVGSRSTVQQRPYSASRVTGTERQQGKGMKHGKMQRISPVPGVASRSG